MITNTNHTKFIEKSDLLANLYKISIRLDDFVNKLLESKKIIVICGPTCTGKSISAINLAKILDTDLISVDSMQIYKGMDIGTDKYKTETSGIRQFMIDLYEPDYNYNAVQFRDLCRELIRENFFEKKKIPILAGGSGLYLRSVLDDLEFVSKDDSNFDERSSKERETIKKEIKNNGLPAAFEKLKNKDPLYCEKISANDERRIIRALEVYNLTGKPFSSFQNKWLERKSIYNTTFLGFTRDKQILHSCIENRIDLMIEKGLLDEVKNLLKKGYKNSNSLKQAVGYKETVEYLEGLTTLEECISEIKKNTKKLAKKQATWFKADKRIKWISIDNYDNILNLMTDMIKIIWEDVNNEKD
jgi:tRNA dimethylallyltransferase